MYILRDIQYTVIFIQRKIRIFLMLEEKEINTQSKLQQNIFSLSRFLFY